LEKDKLTGFSRSYFGAVRKLWTVVEHKKSEVCKNGAVNPLTAFGLFAVTAMLVTYALEKRSSWFILAFAASCALGSVYGFLQGAWPFGVIEAIWAVVAAGRWWRATKG